MTMKLEFKKMFLLTVFVMYLLNCNKANASVRIGVLDQAVINQEQVAKLAGMSMSERGKYMSLKRKDQLLFMDVLSKMNTFELVDLGVMQISKMFLNDRMKQQQMNEYAMRQRDLYYRELGHEAKVRYLVYCDVTFNEAPEEVSANVQLSIFDSGSGEVIQQFTGTGSALLSESAKSGNKSKSSLKKIFVKKNQKKNQPFYFGKNGPAKEQAAFYAMSQVSEYMYRYITEESSVVTRIENGSIILNKGASFGVKAGEIYKVQTEIQRDMEDISSSAFDSVKLTDIALIQIKDVQDDTSTAEVFANAGNINAIRENDKIIIISKLEAEKIVSDISIGTRQPFPDKRPESKRAEVKRQYSEQNKKTAVRESNSAGQPGTIRIGVMKFTSKAGTISNRDASAITDLFMRFLSNSEKITVIERDRIDAIIREHSLSLSGVIDPSTAAEIGRLAGCKYILLGAVTGAEEEEERSGKLKEQKDSWASDKEMAVDLGVAILGTIFRPDEKNVLTETSEITVAIDARVVDVETSRIVMSFTGYGSASQSKVTTQNAWTKDIEKVGVDYGGLQNRAIASAAANLSHKLRGALAGEYMQISSVNDGEIIINKGASAGIQAGDLFCVYPEDKSASYTEAIISVKDVQDSFSTAEVVKSITASYSPSAGSKLEPVLQRDFQKGIWYIKNHKRRNETLPKEQNEPDKSGSLENLVRTKKIKLETSSTDTKKVIRSYGLKTQDEKALIDAHIKAAKMNNTKKKYEAYTRLSEANMNDFLASYNAARYAYNLSSYNEAREWAEKALYINPDYKPAQDLIKKIDGGK